MNKLLTISALAAIATATLPSRRQIDFDPPDASSFPPDCLDSIKEIFKSAPPEPTPVASFTSNFYKTVSRTATATDEECAWITNMPDDVAQSYLDWADDIAEWMADMREDKKGPEISDECNEVFVGTDRGTCTKEWAQFRNDKGGAGMQILFSLTLYVLTRFFSSWPACLRVLLFCWLTFWCALAPDYRWLKL